MTEDGEGNWRWIGVPWEALGGFQIKEWRDPCRTVLFGPYKKLSSLFTGQSGGTPKQDNVDDYALTHCSREGAFLSSD